MSPPRVCPLATVSRLVPSLSISASSPAWEEAESPRTATIAATPMAMPSADRAARSLRVRSPTLDSRARSAGRSRCVAGGAVGGHERRSCVDGGVGGVGDDAPVEHLDPAGHAGGDALVVGDHHDRGAGRVQFFEQREDGLPGGLVEVAGGLVGQHDRRVPDQGAGDRHPLALPARELGGPRVQPVGEPDGGQRLGGVVARRCLSGTPA